MVLVDFAYFLDLVEHLAARYGPGGHFWSIEVAMVGLKPSFSATEVAGGVSEGANNSGYHQSVTQNRWFLLVFTKGFKAARWSLGPPVAAKSACDDGRETS